MVVDMRRKTSMFIVVLPCLPIKEGKVDMFIGDMYIAILMIYAQ